MAVCPGPTVSKPAQRFKPRCFESLGLLRRVWKSIVPSAGMSFPGPSLRRELEQAGVGMFVTPIDRHEIRSGRLQRRLVVILSNADHLACLISCPD